MTISYRLLSPLVLIATFTQQASHHSWFTRWRRCPYDSNWRNIFVSTVDDDEDDAEFEGLPEEEEELSDDDDDDEDDEGDPSMSVDD